MGEYLRNAYVGDKSSSNTHRLERVIRMQNKIIIAQFLLILILIFG